MQKCQNKSSTKNKRKSGATVEVEGGEKLQDCGSSRVAGA